ncbi:MAG: sulfatase-like hydrolase/transferase, partial [Verrucomicrobia bacterium]|nr:sulfatase-like hydrolase/transferase [Verrucomicrobiota bacterium]
MDPLHPPPRTEAFQQPGSCGPKSAHASIESGQSRLASAATGRIWIPGPTPPPQGAPASGKHAGTSRIAACAILVGVVVAIALGGLPFRLDAAEGVKPNFVFILIDDLGWADVGCNGSTYYRTPNIDRLARQGMRFTDAYAACPVCSPTRASILTGRYPARLHLTDWLPGRPDRPDQRLLRPRILPHLPLEEVTLAEALKPAGYV